MKHNQCSLDIYFGPKQEGLAYLNRVEEKAPSNPRVPRLDTPARSSELRCVLYFAG